LIITIRIPHLGQAEYLYSARPVPPGLRIRLCR